VKVATVIDPSKPEIVGVAVTVVPLSTLVAYACHTSAGPP